MGPVCLRVPPLHGGGWAASGSNAGRFCGALRDKVRCGAGMASTRRHGCATHDQRTGRRRFGRRPPGPDGHPRADARHVGRRRRRPDHRPGEDEADPSRRDPAGHRDAAHGRPHVPAPGHGGGPHPGRGLLRGHGAGTDVAFRALEEGAVEIVDQAQGGTAGFPRGIGDAADGRHPRGGDGPAARGGRRAPGAEREAVGGRAAAPAHGGHAPCAGPEADRRRRVHGRHGCDPRVPGRHARRTPRRSSSSSTCRRGSRAPSPTGSTARAPCA